MLVNNKKLLLIMFLSSLTLSVSAQLDKKHDYILQKDILWASPKGFDLTMDIYTPETGKASYPVLIIFHGGGWLINNKSIMDQMSEYIASNAGYVVCNVNYRLLGDLQNTTTMNEIIEDAMGSVLWVKEHISAYKGDPSKIAVTGDSAGGQLTAMVVNNANRLSSDGLTGKDPGFRPTYLPEGRSAEDIARENGLEVQAAILSYPATDIYASGLGGFENPSNFFWSMGGAEARGIFGKDMSAQNNPEIYKLCSPIYTVPKSTDRKLPPQFCQVGSNDNLTTPELVKSYADLLENNGQNVEYWVYEGRPHAYLDSGSNEFLGTNFEKDAIVPIGRMITFLDKVFY